MIQAFQKFSQSRIAKIFLALVALSFIAFGGSRWFQHRNPNAIVAEVGGVAIPRHELAQKLQQTLQSIAAQSGQVIPREQLLETGVPQVVLWELIHDQLLNLEAKHFGLTVSDELVRDRIHTMKAFQNEKGEFDRERFTQILRSNGLSEDSFISEIRQELIRGQLANAVMVGVHLPNEMVDILFNAQFQNRQASMLVIPSQEMSMDTQPNKEVLEGFYNEHKEEFKIPELRTITALVIDPASFEQGITISPEEIKMVYDAKPEIYGKQSLESAMPAIAAELKKEKSTEEIYKITQELDDKIAGGATFEELASTVPGAQLIKLTDVDRRGADWVGELAAQLPQDKALAQELLTAAFQLEEGSDSPFTQAQNGAYFTARADKITPSSFRPFAEIQAVVLKKWVENEKEKAAFAKAEKYTQDFNQGKRTATLMTLLPNVSLAEKSPTVSDEVKNLIYSLQVGQAGMARVPEGFAVVVLNKIIPPTPEVMEEKMDPFKKGLLKNYQGDLLESYVNALRVRYPVKVNNAAIKALLTQQEAPSNGFEEQQPL